MPPWRALDKDESEAAASERKPIARVEVLIYSRDAGDVEVRVDEAALAASEAGSGTVTGRGERLDWIQGVVQREVAAAVRLLRS